MKSPKFSFSFNDLNYCINESNLKKIWKKKLGGQIRKQIVPDLIELKDFDHQIPKIASDLTKEIGSAGYCPETPKHYLVEKSRGLCRQMTLAHPRDLLVLQALSSALQSDIKKSMPTSRAFFEPGDQKFDQKKLLIDHNEYGAIASWKKFQQAIFDFSKERRYIVVTDIANFYDFINFRHLRNIISSLCIVKESVLDFLIYVLNEMAWNPDFMPRTEIGLPQMEVEAPRVLSNAMLFELDKIADLHALGDYVRFMDDIDVGVDTIADAKAAIRDIDLTLQSRQLRLNSSKTKILDTKDGTAAAHFCVEENAALDECAINLETNGEEVFDECRKTLTEYYSEWRGSPDDDVISKNSRFLVGNGEKIFKRLAKLIHYCRGEIPTQDLHWFIKNTPSLRSFSFRYLAHTKPANSSLYTVNEMIETRVFIDDSAFIDVGKFVVQAKFINNQKFRDALDQLMTALVDQRNYYACYAAHMVAIRFQTPDKILELVKRTSSFWKDDFWLARSVGAGAPVMSLDKYASRDYLLFLQKISNNNALDVYEFHDKVSTDANFFKSLFCYAKSKNPSYPQYFYFPKSLIIKSICRNKFASGHRHVILNSHEILKTDPYYKKWKFV